MLRSGPEADSAQAAAPFNIQERIGGVLLPVSSLPSPGPIGDLDGAKPFIGWLAEAGMGLWQILPLGPTDIYGSPYSSWSAFSGSPDFVGIQWCIEAGLLPEDAALPVTQEVDYRMTLEAKRPLVLRAARELLKRPDHPWADELDRFIQTAPWATEAALYYALKMAHEDAPWWRWPSSFRTRERGALERAKRRWSTDLETWRAALFLFELQWAQVRSHASACGVRIVGDMPIYVGAESVDVWAHQELFELDDSGQPTRISGVPPDAYSETGQLWGNPLFVWEACAAENYRWWIERTARSMELCDALRVDHFIGFNRYWAVEAGAEDATLGTWNRGPGRPIFDALEGALGGLALIAEDLGSVDDATLELRDALGLPGMRVLQFGLGLDSEPIHHPDHHVPRSVVYTGTHDSPTFLGWWRALTSDEQRATGLGPSEEEALAQAVEMALSSPSFWAVLPAQDLLGLGDEARMNQPGTLGGNWVWRLPADGLSGALAVSLRQRLERAGRRVRSDGPDMLPR